MTSVDWKSIPCSEIEWGRVPGISRATARGLRANRVGEGKTLGDLAAEGEGVWRREPGVGPVMIAGIKLTIDHAAAGTAILKVPESPIGAYEPRPIAKVAT